MNTDLARHPRLERLLAAVLQYGTWLASGVIALGLALALIGGPADPHALPMLTGAHVVTAGIALLILLPVLRVALMLIVFVLERDYRFGAIAALVLMIIALGIVLGMHVGAATSG
jgi:uncharacterized membrane protein